MKEFTRHDYTEYHLQKYLHFYRSGRRKIKSRIVSRLLKGVQMEECLFSSGKSVRVYGGVHIL
ncbi:MAG: hypothetical protein ACUVUQ_05490 [Thermodesulfovibrionales bacterium]